MVSYGTATDITDIMISSLIAYQSLWVVILNTTLQVYLNYTPKLNNIFGNLYTEATVTVQTNLAVKVRAPNSLWEDLEPWVLVENIKES